MLKILVVLCIIIGTCLLICGFTFKTLKIVAGFGKRKTKDKKTVVSMLEGITAIWIFRKPLDFIARDKKLWTNKFTLRILELSEAGISLQQMYFIKFICLILCTLLTLIITYTNMTYQVKMIIQTSGEETSVLFQDNSQDKSKNLLYEQIISAIGENKLSNASETEKKRLVEGEIAQYINTFDNKLIEDKTQWFLNTWREVQKLRAIKSYHIVIIVMSMFLPEIVLTFRWLLRGSVYKKEIIKLEYIFGLLAKVDGVKTIDIIHELEKSSKIYSKCLHKFTHIYQYDKVKGFEYLKSRNIKSLSKLTSVLEIYSLSDKDIALQVLEREEMERDEAMIITADETIDFIDLVAFLSIVPLVYELAMLMLKPMLDVVYKAFEFI